MGLHDLLSSLGVRRRMTRMTASIARQALPMVAAAVGDRMFAMRLAEARGYVRARARLAVIAEIEAMSAGGQLVPAAMQNELLEMVLDQVVIRMIATRMVEVQTTVPLRRAA